MEVPAAANVPPDITNISAAAPAEEPDAVAATACPAATSAAAADEPASGDDANNCEIFSSDSVGSACRAELNARSTLARPSRSRGAAGTYQTEWHCLDSTSDCQARCFWD